MARYVTNVQAIMPGVRETLKSAPVCSMLATAGESAAARCNALYSIYPKVTRIPPYGSKVVQRNYTAGALVYTATSLGAKDNMKNNTLKKGCGL